MEQLLSTKAREVIKDAENELRKIIGKNVRLICTVGIAATTVQSLKRVISNHYNISWNIIISKTQEPDVVKARHSFSWFAKKYLKMDLKDIAIHVNARDHTTIHYAVEKIDSLLLKGIDPICDDIETIGKKILEK